MLFFIVPLLVLALILVGTVLGFVTKAPGVVKGNLALVLGAGLVVVLGTYLYTQAWLAADEFIGAPIMIPGMELIPAIPVFLVAGVLGVAASIAKADGTAIKGGLYVSPLAAAYLVFLAFKSWGMGDAGHEYMTGGAIVGLFMVSVGWWLLFRAGRPPVLPSPSVE